MTKPKLALFFPLIQAVGRIKSKKEQKTVLKHLSKDQNFVSCLREIAKNIIAGNVKLSEKEKRILNKHSSIVRALAKKKRVAQSGGFIQAVLPLLATVVSDLLL